LLAVDARHLSKTFQTKQGQVQAVQDVSFAVAPGEIFGILGPNGAGKSTTILILTTLLRATGGSAQILGFDVEQENVKVRTKIGVALQETGIDEILTGRELLQSTGRLWGLGKLAARHRSDELLQLVRLTDAADRRVKTYSGGMKRRLDLALSLVHEPKVLFLDEPTAGLDPGSRRVLWDEILRLRDTGVTIILTTQYLEEADELADRIAIIHEGCVVSEGTPNELKASIGGDVVAFSFTSEEATKQAAEISPGAEAFETELRITVQNGPKFIPELFSKFVSAGIDVIAVSSSKPTLDDVFLKVTGFSLEDAEERRSRPSQGNPEGEDRELQS
jgi:ABC-2 type transport system ATP-binding protein